MASGLNKVTLIGNLGADPEVRNLESGLKFARLSIATTEGYKDNEGNRQEQTEWHRIVLWRGLAEIAEKYLRKGSRVYLEGKLQTRQWEDQEGVTRYTTEIAGRQMIMLDGSKQGNSQSPPPPPPPKQDQGGSLEAETDDDLPF